MPTSLSFPSELVAGGKVVWKTLKAKATPDVDIRWSVNWNEIVNGVSTMGAYEFQGW